MNKKYKTILGQKPIDLFFGFPSGIAYRIPFNGVAKELQYPFSQGCLKTLLIIFHAHLGFVS